MIQTINKPCKVVGGEYLTGAYTSFPRKLRPKNKEQQIEMNDGNPGIILVSYQLSDFRVGHEALGTTGIVTGEFVANPLVLNKFTKWAKSYIKTNAIQVDLYDKDLAHEHAFTDYGGAVETRLYYLVLVYIDGKRILYHFSHDWIDSYMEIL